MAWCAGSMTWGGARGRAARGLITQTFSGCSRIQSTPGISPRSPRATGRRWRSGGKSGAHADWQLVPSDRWEPLIDRDRWARIQGLVAARSRKAAQAAPYLFSGIVACPFRGCKGHLIGATNHKRRGKPYYRYACNVEPRQHRCMTWPRDHLEARILEALEGVGDHPTAQVRVCARSRQQPGGRSRHPQGEPPADRAAGRARQGRIREWGLRP